jgi:hypothetical protein
VNVRRDTLHSAFYALLDRLLPKDEYLAFYSRIVLDTVKQQRAHVATERALLENRIAGLKERKNRLVDAFVYKQAISEDIYHEQLQTVEQGLALAESQKDELLSDELDVEGILNFADILIREALRLWMEAPLEQKQRMQEVLFPEGLAYSELGGFGTPVTCFAFKVLPEDWQEIEVMASPTGFAIMWTVEFSGIVRRAA